MMNIWTKLCSALRNFRVARGGNVAITFAFATIPVLGAVGAGFDFSHANSVKADMQAALDSTALMLAKDASTLSSGDLNTKAMNYFTALFNRPNEASINSVSATYTASAGSQVVVNGSVNVPTTFLRALGASWMQNITVTGSSTTKWGTTRLRVALVLDNTGSMADDNKIVALKSATHSLLSQLQAAASQNGDVYVSIIPFSKDVNVGSANYNGNWIDWDDWEAANGSWVNTPVCNSHASARGRSRCQTTQTWVPSNHNTWNGCITDRDQNYDQNVTAPNPADASLPAASASTLFPAEQYGNCPLQMMGLSYDWTSMSSLVDQMYPNGNTNQPIGLVWGWQSLVGGGPLSAPAMDSNYKYQQVIILLSDGLNTQDRWYTSQSSIDYRMVDTSGNGTCANIKAAGVTIYAIQVNTGGDPMSTLMQSCASSSDKFWMLTSSTQIMSVFNTIGTNLTKLRVAR